MFIDLPCSEITAEFFERHCLQQNKCLIARNCSDFMDTMPLRRALCALELHVSGGGTSMSDKKSSQILRVRCREELMFLQQYDQATCASSRHIKHFEFPIEIEPRVYATMTLEKIFSSNCFGDGLFASLLLSPDEAMMPLEKATDSDDRAEEEEEEEEGEEQVDDDPQQQQHQQQHSRRSSWGRYFKDFHFVEFWEQLHRDMMHLSSSSLSTLSSTSLSPAPVPSSFAMKPLYELPLFMRAYAQDCIMQRFQRRGLCAAAVSPNSRDEQQPQQQQFLPAKFGAGHDYKFVYAAASFDDHCLASNNNSNKCSSKSGSGLTDTHFDVCATYSFSVNLTGFKRWIFARDEAENERLRSVLFRNNNSEESDNSASSRGAPPSQIEQSFEIEQGPGDLVFVPSLLVHRVESYSLVDVNRGCNSEKFKKPADRRKDSEKRRSNSVPRSAAVISFNHNWYVMPYTIPHLMHLLQEHTTRSLNLIGAETVEILRGDETLSSKCSPSSSSAQGCDQQQHHHHPLMPRTEFEMIFNAFQNSTGAFSLSVVRELLLFALQELEQEGGVEPCSPSSFSLLCVTKDATRDAILRGLATVQELERSVFL